jgi:hypothetical protein
MSGFATIRSAIYAKLQTVTSLSFAYDYYRDVVEGHPSAMFDVTTTENTFLTNESNQRMYSWTMYVAVETQIKSVADAGGILDAVCDEIVDAFENDLTLGGAVQWVEPLTGGRDEVETPQGTMLVQTIIINTITTTPCQ